MNTPSSLDDFFFYLFLPIITVICIYIYRLYNIKKEDTNHISKISTGILIGNILYSIIGSSIFLMLFFYIITPELLQKFKWELIILSSIAYTYLLIGIGIGSHAAGSAIEFQTRKLLINKKYSNISETLHYYHASLGHKLPYIGIILTTYSLTLLDLFKGQIVPMSKIENTLSIITGLILGSLLSFLSIITYCQKIVKNTTIIIFISIIITILNESITLSNHPVAMLFTYLYGTIITLLIIESHLPRWIINILIKTSQKLLKWDGILLNSNHYQFRKQKNISSKN